MGLGREDWESLPVWLMLVGWRKQTVYYMGLEYDRGYVNSLCEVAEEGTVHRLLMRGEVVAAAAAESEAKGMVMAVAAGSGRTQRVMWVTGRLGWWQKDVGSIRKVVKGMKVTERRFCEWQREVVLRR